MLAHFETERLLLREYRPTDLLFVHQYASQPLVVQYQNWEPNSLENTQQFLHRVQHHRTVVPRMPYELCIQIKENSQPIRGCELAISPEDPSIASLGYILDPLVWQQGYATEASKGSLRFGFTQLGLQRIQATCDAQNVGSIRVLEKSGFRLEATLVHDFMQRGIMRTTLVYAYDKGAARW